jgi:sulfite exporter TauE/SafE
VTTLLGGVLLTTVISGRLITRTGRYKPYPVVGTALAALGLALLATVGAGSGATVIGGVLLLIGLGVGFVLQVMTLVTQNAVDIETSAPRPRR